VKGIKAPTLMGVWLKTESGSARRRRKKRKMRNFFIRNPENNGVKFYSPIIL
jgi:hypothetical protein